MLRNSGRRRRLRDDKKLVSQEATKARKGVRTRMSQVEESFSNTSGLTASPAPGMVETPRPATDVTERSETEIAMSELWKSGSKAFFDARDDFQPPMPAGQALRAIREHRGVALSTVAKELRLDQQYFMAIERMEVARVPRGYLTKYLGSYASYLGLPRDEIVTAYTRECGAVETVETPSPIVSMEAETTPAWKRPAVLVAGALPVCAIVGAMFLALDPSVPGDTPRIMAGEPLDGARESLFAGGTLPEGAMNKPFPLTLTATREAWLEVRGADGTIFRSRSMSPGETYHPRIGAGWTVSARDGGAFEWRLGDAVIASLGPEGGAVYAASVDSAAARAAEIAAPALASASPGKTSR